MRHQGRPRGRRNSTRKHAKGYVDYARLDSLRYHAAYCDGYDSDGTPLCVCSYPLMPTKEEKAKAKESSA
jgi:hypothetical protein